MSYPQSVFAPCGTSGTIPRHVSGTLPTWHRFLWFVSRSNNDDVMSGVQKKANKVVTPMVRYEQNSEKMGFQPAFSLPGSSRIHRTTKVSLLCLSQPVFTLSILSARTSQRNWSEKHKSALNLVKLKQYTRAPGTDDCGVRTELRFWVLLVSQYSCYCISHRNLQLKNNKQ